MVTFIDDHQGAHGIGPICEVLPIAPSAYYTHKAIQADPSLRSPWAQRDEWLKGEIEGVWKENRELYGAEKVWKRLNREGISVAWYTVRRLMKEIGLQGAVRGRAFKTTTIPGEEASRPLDMVDRDFQVSRPNELWVSDLTYVATWRGFVYVAFVNDAYARRIAGWRVSTSLLSDFALYALEQAISERGDDQDGRLCTIAIVGFNISVFGTRSAWPTKESTPRSAVSATRARMPWPNPLLACSRRKSSGGWGRGGTWRMSSSRPSSGSGGSTTIASWGPSDMFPQ